ncbi:hypothetical protein G7046_g4421 [Stylonectria norvegica]|nr:hypothetical protein G7046_g4421 [Stylonectria norvegica]
MLAVQQAPRMGSSQPPSDDPFLPFGYNVDPNQEPLLEPPEPAPGAPLLSENDSKLLSSFFEDMTADHYNMPSFGEGLNFSDTWLDLPPQFMGTATSFGQQPGTAFPPSVDHGLPTHRDGFQDVPNHQDGIHGLSMDSSMMPPPPPPPPPSRLEHRPTPDDVLHAAATLLHNGSIQRHNSASSESPFPRRAVGLPVGHLRHQPLEEFREDGRRSLSTGDHDNTFTEWMFGPQERRNPRNVPPTDVQWGSDSNFSHLQGFTPNSDKETTESLSNEQLKYLDCLEPSQSAGNTRPSSPNYGEMGPPTNHDRLTDLVKRQPDVDAPPRKRRKSRNSKEARDDEADDETSTTKTARRRKPKTERTTSAASPPADDNSAAGKRRRSAAAAKAARENLSEEQKRENHIRSEQKRRTLIKEGFDDLCDLVPGLRGGGFSKSTMLTMAADWLDEIIKGNEILAAQLSSVEGG